MEGPAECEALHEARRPVSSASMSATACSQQSLFCFVVDCTSNVECSVVCRTLLLFQLRGTSDLMYMYKALSTRPGCSLKAGGASLSRLFDGCRSIALPAASIGQWLVALSYKACGVQLSRSSLLPNCPGKVDSSDTIDELDGPIELRFRFQRLKCGARGLQLL